MHDLRKCWGSLIDFGELSECLNLNSFSLCKVMLIIITLKVRRQGV
jgi:hypothetical protein